MTTILDRFFGTFLGIEFKEDSLIVTCLKNSLYGINPLSSATFSLKDNNDIFPEIKAYLSQHGVTTNRAFVSIPDKWALTKFTEVPLTKGKGRDTLSQLMRFEIERHIPFQVEDVSYDFQVVDEKDSTCRVVFVVVREEKVDYIKGFLEKLSLRPQGITISSFAALNAIELGGVTKGNLQEVIGFTRKYSVLGQKGEVNISLYVDRMNASLAILKNGFCINLKNFIIDISKPLEVFLDDIGAYLNTLPELAIESFNKLVLSGDTSFIPNFIEVLKKKLRIEVVTVRPFTGLKGTDMQEIAPSIGACFAGLGIGKYRINILPHEVQYEIKKITSLTTIILISLILLLIIGIFTTEAVKQKMLLVKIEEALKKNEPAVVVLKRLSSDFDSYKIQRDFLLGVKENEITLEVLAELTRVLPKDAWITTLDYKGVNIKNEKKTGGELTMSGFADSSSRLIPLLEDSPFFEKVEFVGPIKKTRDKEGFKLKAHIVRPVSEGREP